VDAFVEGPAGDVSTVWTESNAVNRLQMTSQLMDALATFHVPQTNSRVKRSTDNSNTRTTNYRVVQIANNTHYKATVNKYGVYRVVKKVKPLPD